MKPADDFDDREAEGAGGDAWRQIEGLIEQIAELSRSHVSDQEFYALLLENAVRAGEARGGLIWKVDFSGGLQIQAEHQIVGKHLFADPAMQRENRRFLDSVREQANARWISPETSGGESLPESVGGSLFACAVWCDQRAVGIVEVLQRPGLTANACQGYAAILETLCELAGDFHQRAQLRLLESQQAEWQAVEDFISCVHEDLDTETVADRIANDGRRLAGCDRLVVLVRRGARYRVAAVSGLDQVQARSNTVRYLLRVVEKVAANREPLWFSNESNDLPPELESAIRDYVDLSHARTLAILPLDGGEIGRPADRRGPIGALVFETFDFRPLDGEYRQCLTRMERHSCSALQNAERFSRVPLVRWLAALQDWMFRGRGARYAFAVTSVLAVIAALTLVPADFDIVCRGEAQPQQRRQIFSPVEGLVDQIHVEHGESVAAGQPLVTLESPELTFEITQVMGEMQTVKQQLTSLKSARLGSSPVTAADREEAARLAAEERRLQQVYQGLESQMRLRKEQLDSLDVRSPIDAQVLTWEVSKRLQARPVQRGQLLMTIGDTDGPWIVELRVLDKDVLGVRRAQEESGRDLPVTLMPASDPGSRYVGRLQHLAMRIEPDANQQLSALATVRLDSQDMPPLRPGAGMTARIHCGRRALGYVWLRDLIAAVRRWLFI